MKLGNLLGRSPRIMNRIIFAGLVKMVAKVIFEADFESSDGNDQGADWTYCYKMDLQ